MRLPRWFPRLGERFKGWFSDPSSVGGGGGDSKLVRKGWQARCAHYDGIWERFGLAKSQTLTIAGQLMAEGLFLSPSEKGGTRASEAVELCEELNRRVHMDRLLYDTPVAMVKYGSCFWEKTTTPEFNVRIMPQMEKLVPSRQDGNGEVDQWQLRVDSAVKAQFNVPGDIVHFPWNVTSQSWPYGTSLYIGVELEFEIIEQMEKDIKEFMHKNAFPKEMYQVGDKDFTPPEDEVASINNKVKNWQPGQSFTTSYPINKVMGGVGDRDVRNLNEVLVFLKDQAVDVLMVPPISRQYNATQASAEEMMPWAHANLIRPMQRVFNSIIEDEVYKPYLESEGYSVKLRPTIHFTDPSSARSETADYYVKLVQAGICPPVVAARALNIDEGEFTRWKEEEKRMEAEKMQFQKQQMANRPEGGDSNWQRS